MEMVCSSCAKATDKKHAKKSVNRNTREVRVECDLCRGKKKKAEKGGGKK